ncbi:MAG TPA: PIN domain-containing protein [Candidatus Acidoferrum sp.]|jgi:predicted nucleic acid-binding protein|nr:PIN domain-containing protein [Candidatus Acidoferrum sp.]
MNDRFFLDTNIFVYSFDQSTLQKAERADRLIHKALTTSKGIISFQVVQEFFNVAYRRFPEPMRFDQAENYLASVLRPLWTVNSSPALCIKAIQILERFRVQWYDALIVAGALKAECGILYSEDFQNGQKFDDLEVRNPFLEPGMR